MQRTHNPQVACDGPACNLHAITNRVMCCVAGCHRFAVPSGRTRRKCRRIGSVYRRLTDQSVSAIGVSADADAAAKIGTHRTYVLIHLSGYTEGESAYCALQRRCAEQSRPSPICAYAAVQRSAVRCGFGRIGPSPSTASSAVAAVLHACTPCNAARHACNVLARRQAAPCVAPVKSRERCGLQCATIATQIAFLTMRRRA